jgi:hypothetical protein
LNAGDRNAPRSWLCAAWISTPSQPASAACFAERANPSITSRMSAAVISAGCSWNWVDATGDGAQSGRHSSMYIVPEPCAPPQKSWTTSFAPCV